MQSLADDRPQRLCRFIGVAPSWLSRQTPQPDGRCALHADRPLLRGIGRRAAAMNLNQIRYVVALIEELSFSRAARRCGVTQPSVSNSIVALEQELGGPLFFRKPKIQLTDLGRALQANLAAIDQLAAETKDVARRLTNQPTVAVGVAPEPQDCSP
jgi:hypothetical protein